MTARRQTNLDQICRIVRRQKLSGFALCDSYFVDEVVVPAHSHDQTHITLILKGACYETYLGKTRTLEPLIVTYFHPGESHALRVLNRNFRTFDIELNDDWLGRLLERPIAPAALVDNQNNSIAWLTTRLYQEFKEMDDVSGLAMEGLVLEMLAALARASKPVKTKRSPRWLRRVVETVQDEFARPLTLSELAKTAGVHPSHLAQVFREHYRCALGEFIRRIRVERAIEQMADPDASLSDISLATGFSDQSHFSRVFKRVTGMTPAQYRRLNLNTTPVQNTRESSKTDLDS